MNLLLAALLLFQDKTPEQVLQKLRSDKPEERGEAREELKRLGTAVIPALEKASQDADPNYAQEARQVLEVIRAAPANAAFGKIEATLRKAKTIRVIIKGEQENEKGKATSQGTMLLKEGNRARITQNMTQGEIKLSPKLICDGVTLSMPFGDVDPDKRIPPRNLTALLASALARVGIGESFMCFRKLSMDETASEADPNEVWKISNLAEGADEGGFKVLRYRVISIERPLTLEAKLWYDPITFQPRKRLLLFDHDGNKWTDTESYEDFVLGTDIADEKFKFTDSELSQMDMNVYQAKFFIGAITEALEKYRKDTGAYPTTGQGLEAILRSPEGTKSWKGPYLGAPQIPKDPWGNAFTYRFPGTRDPKEFDLLSCGPDGKLGTKDDVWWVKPKPPEEKK